MLIECLQLFGRFVITITYGDAPDHAGRRVAGAYIHRIDGPDVAPCIPAGLTMKLTLRSVVVPWSTHIQ